MTHSRGRPGFVEPGEQEPPRHGRMPSPTASAGALALLGRGIAIVLAAGLVLGCIAAVRIWSQLQTVDAGDDARTDAAGAFTVLLVGTDDRTGQGGEFGEGQDEAAGRRNDVNMLLHVAEDHRSATVVSIPRDLLFDAPSCRSDEGEQLPEQEGAPFNSIQQEGGMSCIIAAAEQLSGLPVDYAAMVQFRGVIEMSNAVGGVTVCVENPIEDEHVGLSLPAGFHSLQGEEALKFLRTRHGVGDGSDLSRISNQQIFLSALVRKMREEGTLSNPGALYGLATAAVRNMTLTSNLANPEVLAGLARATADVPLESFVFVQLPVRDAEDGAHVVLDEPGAASLFDALRHDRAVQLQDGASGPSGPAPPAGQEGADGQDEQEQLTADPPEPGTPEEDTASPRPGLTGQDSSQERCSNG